MLLAFIQVSQSLNNPTGLCNAIMLGKPFNMFECHFKNTQNASLYITGRQNKILACHYVIININMSLLTACSLIVSPQQTKHCHPQYNSTCYSLKLYNTQSRLRGWIQLELALCLIYRIMALFISQA